ncbi:YbdD/YjiX family protein [Pseudonocardia xinjiangensis]|uniref:YbdD/YjiX family protein n=1 Tax=Pseudonocardia xinjiangensis TaxID=75289 RepID=A0ABX1R7U3_9PSEU|nr:YbdD/YjiX family protein [Pseudonocardia xinjiangensis]NMH76117.1 YbdD/YjiX family protein [Pseudonocardia xinjiangensis]
MTAIGKGAIWQGVRWYLRELTGESQYERYLERHAREHPGTAPLSRREFERRRIDAKDATPGSRCC